MASEQVLDIPVRRHVPTSERPGGGTQVAYDTVASAIALTAGEPGGSHHRSASGYIGQIEVFDY